MRRAFNYDIHIYRTKFWVNLLALLWLKSSVTVLRSRDVVQCEEFHTLTPDQLVQLISSDRLIVPNEEKVSPLCVWLPYKRTVGSGSCEISYAALAGTLAR